MGCSTGSTGCCCWQDTRAAAVRARIAMVFITDTDWLELVIASP